ncbi:universal stress protein [Alterinioella nitratireducens]|uniref:universal stress protein n=1 Tax=Alterinioella nitratireducens TaxID=2735915 RepID=UPI000C8938DA|nr:universal stress protein [Alterinioella nitratireducens]MAN15588.1 universal stress protein UspA [Dinoroseobacter sp.]NPD21461.1 universal stress protein [Alterinioella nitratireducens]
MFRKIMIPVDLGHVEALERALQVGADLAGHYGAEVHYVSVTGTAPSKIAHSPEEFREKLNRFAAAEAEARSIASTHAHTVISHDPSVDMDHQLCEAMDEIGADLVVMGSHIPHWYEFGSHGGKLAAHAHCSVMIVRDDTR